MAKVEVTDSLYLEIEKKFKHKSVDILQNLKSLELSPKKGKVLGNVEGIIIKEIKYEGFRFYFITDGFKIKCLDEKELIDLLIRFVRMSNKKEQQKTINEIKHILTTIGPGGFD